VCGQLKGGGYENSVIFIINQKLMEKTAPQLSSNEFGFGLDRMDWNKIDWCSFHTDVL